MAENEFDMRVSIEVKDYKWSGNLKDLARIEVVNLNRELQDQPNLVAWFGVVLAEAVSIQKEVEWELDKAFARLHLAEKAKGQKGVTETEIRSRIHSDPEYQQKVEDLMKITKQVDILKKIMVALDHKRDMLVQLSANTRKEYGG